LLFKSISNMASSETASKVIEVFHGEVEYLSINVVLSVESKRSIWLASNACIRAS